MAVIIRYVKANKQQQLKIAVEAALFAFTFFMIASILDKFSPSSHQ